MTNLRLNGSSGTVDLTRIDCVGCRYREAPSDAPAAPVCRRYPPVFRPATPVQAPDGTQGIAPGGWAFPPAVVKCGEHAAR